MEEAAILSTRVGILANRILATGATEELIAENSTYEASNACFDLEYSHHLLMQVHFSTRTSDELKRVRELMLSIPGSKMAEDVATRFEVPISNEISLPLLFRALRTNGNTLEYAVERASLESIFLKVIRQHQIDEELEIPQGHKRFTWKRTRKHV